MGCLMALYNCSERTHTPHKAMTRVRPPSHQWHLILAESGVSYPWVSSCPYSDKVTYE